LEAEGEKDWRDSTRKKVRVDSDKKEKVGPIFLKNDRGINGATGRSTSFGTERGGGGRRGKNQIMEKRAEEEGEDTFIKPSPYQLELWIRRPMTAVMKFEPVRACPRKNKKKTLLRKKTGEEDI